ncbi:RHS repeat-associated core domain-containing protein [Desulfofarcimen acetoxidans]|uniref:RHS repeat-associated core domain-containing protein n=1 Tax=Desulfofarcimen acetoxidans TaxID=58138 RepID=UPI001F60F9A3|nr:RHS repeat-associated core domain-containing protein [Desulfofarcimen acetoxidans]
MATYTYNHDGTRRNKVTAQGTTNYNWDASGNLIREIGPNGTYCYYYVSGKLIAFENNHQLYIVHDNLRGDVISLSTTDDYGNTDQENRYDYDPWGSPICEDESVKLPFRYAGYYYDTETGLYYLKSRYYSPALGRFLTRDPHSFINHADPQTLNLYAYCGNNPVNYVDPDGNTIDDIKSGLRNAGNAVYNEARTWADAWLDCPFTGGAVFTGGIGIIKGIKGAGKATGQMHHILSNKTMKALNEHPTLKGVFKREDAAFKYRAQNADAHKGYQQWHRDVDNETVKWLQDNPAATSGQFKQFLNDLYQQPNISSKIPGVNIK